MLNWVALKPSQINGTIFNDIDDESILQVNHFFISFNSATTIKMIDRSLFLTDKGRPTVPHYSEEPILNTDWDKMTTLRISIQATKLRDARKKIGTA